MSQMKSFYMPTGFGQPPTYKMGELPKPVISKPDHVLIRVHAASLNPIDLRYTTGSLKMVMERQEFPSKIGYDVSGVLEEVGEEAAGKGWKAGDEIFAVLPHRDRGSLSEYALTTAHYIARKPKNLSHIEAASIPLVGTTAYQAFSKMNGGIEGLKDKTVLVTAGLGGTGSMGVQVAKALGAKEVITTVSTSKLPRAKELFDGVVDNFIDYKVADPATVLKPRSLDFIYDTTGSNIVSLFPLLKENHGLVTIATVPRGDQLKSDMFSAPPYIVTPANLLSRFRWERPARNAGVNYSYCLLVRNGKDLTEIAKFVEEGRVKPVIGEILDFTEEGCRQATEVVLGGGSKHGGKVVVQVVK
ncbi:Zeta-crystallin [Dactylella cylindrospora]|nr:Zeta-crystallin [Dactylella cylindrospora]